MFLIKWLILLLIGAPVQGLVYLLYPVLVLVWALFIYQPVQQKLPPHHDFKVDSSIGSATTDNGRLLDNVDDHGAFTMYGFIQKEGLEDLVVDGSVIRKRNADGTYNRWEVSGDVVVSWLFANTVADRKVSDEVLKSVVDTYIKNLGTLSYDETAQGYVSTRCSNFGVNIALDSAFLKLSQPMTGPQFYTTQAVLASAYHLGWKYKAMYWTHWVLGGGWYWAWAPMIYPNMTDWWYVRDITMKALYVQLQEFGPRWYITKPMKFINDRLCTHQNDLFNAMMNRDISNPLPASMNAFFSQYEDASSYVNDRMSAYIPGALLKIKSQTRWK